MHNVTIEVKFPAGECSGSHSTVATKQDLEEMEGRLLMKYTELAAGLVTLTEQAQKSHLEIVGKIGALEEALDNMEDVPTEVQTAFDALKAQVQSVDDIVQD